MGKIKNLRLVLVFVALVLVFTLIRISNRNLFTKNAVTAIVSSENGANLISPDELKSKPAEYLLVNLNRADNSGVPPLENSVKIPYENLLDKENRKILKETDLKIVLYSEDISIASKAWIILNQLNFNNVYILVSDKNEEVLKYKFQPDTTARLEDFSL